MSDEKEKLIAAGQAISTAVMILRMELPTIEAFLKESRLMEGVGPIIDPTLFNKSERRAAEAVVLPLFNAAVDFVRVYDSQIARSKEALAKVRA